MADKRCVLFVAQTVDELISIYDIDPETGALELLANNDSHGPVGPLCLHPSGEVLLAANAGSSALTSFRLDGHSLTLINQVDTGIAAPAHLITDRNARYLLSAHYTGGGITVRGLAEDGTIGEQLQHLQTGEKAHSVVASPDDRFVFVPHVCPTNRTAQLRFDRSTGHLTPNHPAELAAPDETTRSTPHLFPARRRCGLHRQRTGQHRDRPSLRR